MWGWIKDAAKDAWDFIKSIWDAVAGYFENLWASVWTAVSGTWTAIKNAAQDAWNFVSSVWNGVVAFFQGIGHVH